MTDKLNDIIYGRLRVHRHPMTGNSYFRKVVFVLYLLFLLATPSPVLALRAVFLADTQGGKGLDNFGVKAAELEVAVRSIAAMQPKPDMHFCLGDLVGRGFVADNVRTIYSSIR